MTTINFTSALRDVTDAQIAKCHRTIDLNTNPPQVYYLVEIRARFVGIR